MLALNRFPAAIAGIGLAVLTGFPSRAAEIRRDTVNGIPVILLSGQIEYGDEQRFLDVAQGMDRAVVGLGSPGGNLHAGMETGKAIRARGYDTAVPNVCASACALAWLGGRKRLVAREARVGFHGAWMERNCRTEVVSGGNALVGAYLNQMGFSQSAILYMTTAGPQEITWLTPGDAVRQGIEVEWKDGGGAPVTAPAAPTVPIREVSSARATPSVRDWSGYGEWVQVASRKSLEEAVPIAKAMARNGTKASVFRSDRGLYAVTVGPYGAGRGKVALDALVGAGKAPRDSLVTLGGRFASLAWGTPPGERNAAPVYEGPGSLRDED